MKRIRVFITGATGFLGGALAGALARVGAEVHALARATSDRSGLDGAAVTWHEGDVTDPSSLCNAMAGADWVVHAAGRLGVFGVREEDYERVHVGGTRNVLSAALESGGRTRVLHVSTTGVLGLTPGGPAAEDSPYAPANPYERSKATAEQVALEFASQGLAVVICRPALVYGPGDRHVLGLFQAVRRGRFFLIDGAEHVCHPTFIADAVAGMLLCLRIGRPGAIYHIAGPRAVTFREWGETIAGALRVRPPWLILPRWAAMLGAMGLEILAHASGRKPPLSRAGVAFLSTDRYYSWQRAHDELGYSPEFDLAPGVARSIAWYRGQGWL
jgi:nucleoside-diphosphate-sugar epimerase